MRGPLEIAQRAAEEAALTEALKTFRDEKSAIDAIVAEGDPRLIDDGVLDRSWKCELAVRALEKSLEIARSRAGG